MIEKIRSYLNSFEYVRFRNWLIVGLTYAIFYFGRYNFSSAHATIAQNFGWKYTDYAFILSAGLLVYGISVFFNGPLADKIGGKKSLLIGSFGAAVSNLVFGLTNIIYKNQLEGVVKMTSLINWFALVWMVNYYFQSYGALSIVKINSAWFQLKERGVQAGRFGILIQLGRLMVFLLCPIFLYYLPWHWSFIIPSILLFLTFFLTSRFVFNSPEDLGYHVFDTPPKPIGEIKLIEILKKVFATRIMWILTATSLCIGISRNSIDHWFARFFIDQFHIQKNALITYLPYKVLSLLMPALMIISGILAGNASDRIFNSRRGPIFMFSFIGQLFSLLGLALFINYPWMSMIMICSTLFFIQVGHTVLAGTASMDYGGRKAAATATGLLDGIQYLGGAFVGYGIGWVLQHFKGDEHMWKMWALFPLPTIVVGIFLSIYLWDKKPTETFH
jgi:OPA family glycerol-3-phosphate transporter-like MFS transporter